MSDPTPVDAPSMEAVLREDAAHHSGLFAPSLALARGEDCWVWDADGNRYLDCMAGIAVASVGHANERLAEAISRQARRLLVSPQNLANDARNDFVSRLMELLPAPLNRVFLSNSGTEANEAALKWARVAGGGQRRRFVAAKRGFAGRTMGALSTTAQASYREPFGAPPFETTFVRYGDVDELERVVDDDTAAVMLEPIQGEGGVHPVPDGYLRAARDVAHRHGALLILDEIQSGSGRTGRFLAAQHDGVTPDVVTLAKGLGGGVPIGATVMTDEVAEAMPKGGHGTTFGGNPLASAAGAAVLAELVERDLMGNAERVGASFKAALEGLPEAHVRTVRGRGLLLGVELRGKAAPVVAALRRAGVLVIAAGSNVVRFVPPLTFTEAHAEQAVAALATALEEVAAA